MNLRRYITSACLPVFGLSARLFACLCTLLPPATIFPARLLAARLPPAAATALLAHHTRHTTPCHTAQLFNANGVPIEPFHLRAERAEGFFDEEGNYVLRRGPRPMRDAWLDSLQVGMAGVGRLRCR